MLGDNDNGLVKASYDLQERTLVVTMDLLCYSIAEKPPQNEEVRSSGRADCT